MVRDTNGTATCAFEGFISFYLWLRRANTPSLVNDEL